MPIYGQNARDICRPYITYTYPAIMIYVGCRVSSENLKIAV